MDQGQKIVKNSIFVTGGQSFNKLIALISVPIIARLLGTEGFGLYTLAYSIVMLFGGISDLGTDYLTIRDVSRDKSLINKFLTTTLIIRFIFSALIYILIIIVVKILNYPNDILKLISILGVIIFANFLINTFNSIIISSEKMEISSLVSVIQYLITTISVVIMLYLKFDLKTIFSVVVLANLSLAIIYAFWVNKLLIHLKWQINFRFWRYIIKNSLPFAILNILGIIYLQNGVIILSKLQNLEAVGIFNAAYKLILAFLFIPSSFILVFFPTISRQTIDKTIFNLKNSCEKALRALFLIAFPITLSTTLLSRTIIKLLFGNSFLEASLVLNYLIWSLLFMFITPALGIVMINSKHLRKVIYVIGIITLISIGLNFLFILKFNYLGGAISILITEILKFIICYQFIKKYLGFKIDLINTLKKPVVLGLAVGILIYLLRLISLHPLVIILFSAIFYLILLIATKEFIFIEVIKKSRDLIRRYMLKSSTKDNEEL